MPAVNTTLVPVGRGGQDRGLDSLECGGLNQTIS